MRIAVPYENDSIFQHFGKTEVFAFYDFEKGQLVSKSLLKTGNVGHEALAGLLKENAVDILLCGGLGSGAEAALQDAGIRIYAGLTGSADDAVEAFRKDELSESGANCSHHEEGEGCGCGNHEEGEGCGGCGGGCGGCGGHCHEAPEIILEGKNAGKMCKVHYRGTLDDGSQFDSSYDRNEPMEFLCGAGLMIGGFDRAVCDMEVGASTDIRLEPADAYGEYSAENVLNLKIADLPGSEELSVGQQVVLRNNYGQAFHVTVTEKDDENITLDGNHELAGKALNFHIELLEVSDREQPEA